MGEGGKEDLLVRGNVPQETRNSSSVLGPDPESHRAWRLVQKIGLAVASGKQPLGHHAGGRLVHLYQDRVAIVRQVI